MNIEELARNYKIDKAGAEIVSKAKLVFLCGIVAAGKDTVLEQILKLPGYRRIISHTTRPRRSNNGVVEKDSIDYHFVSVEQMAELLVNQKMVEINNFGGNYYGTSIAEVAGAADNNDIAVTDIDIHGVDSFRKIVPGLIAVFLVPPNYGIWMARLEKRYESKADFLTKIYKERSPIAIGEINHALSDPKYYFLVNDSLSQTVQELDKIIKRASRGEKYDDSVARSCAKNLLSDLISKQSQN